MTEAAQLEAESKRTQQVNKTGFKTCGTGSGFFYRTLGNCANKPQAHIACNFFVKLTLKA